MKTLLIVLAALFQFSAFAQAPAYTLAHVCGEYSSSPRLCVQIPFCYAAQAAVASGCQPIGDSALNANSCQGIRWANSGNPAGEKAQCDMANQLGQCTYIDPAKVKSNFCLPRFQQF